MILILFAWMGTFLFFLFHAFKSYKCFYMVVIFCLYQFKLFDMLSSGFYIEF